MSLSIQRVVMGLKWAKAARLWGCGLLLMLNIIHDSFPAPNTMWHAGRYINDPPVSYRRPTPLSAPDPSPLIKPRQRRKAARPQELLEAGLRLFLRKGLAGTRIEDVAREAGASKGTLYLYYPSKDDLFKAVVRHYLTQVIVEAGNIADVHDGPSAALLHQLASTWWLRIGSSEAAGLVVLLMNEAAAFPELTQFYMDEVLAPTHALLQRVLERGMARGEFRSLDINSVAHGLIAPVQFLILYKRCTSVCAVNPVPMDPERFLDLQIDMLLNGLAIPQPLSRKEAS
jgi:TetR/AcrR family transcriptional regulator